MQGQGLGRLLLADALNRAQTADQSVGSAGIFVDAIDDMSSRFYQGFGFQAYGDQPLKLFLAMWLFSITASIKRSIAVLSVTEIILAMINLNTKNG